MTRKIILRTTARSLSFYYFRIYKLNYFSLQVPSLLPAEPLESHCNGSDQGLNETLISHLSNYRILERTKDCDAYFNQHVAAVALVGYE